jgi:flagellar motility protein MotE (MotC chaperone)
MNFPRCYPLLFVAQIVLGLVLERPCVHAQGSEQGDREVSESIREDNEEQPSQVVEDLPSEAELQQALGLAVDVLKREQDQLRQEQMRLESLRAEIRVDLKRVSTSVASTKRSTSVAPEKKREKEKKDRLTKSRNSRVRKIAKGLIAMSPEAAAVAINNMDDELAIELLSVLPGKKVGKIYEALDAKKVASLIKKQIGKKSKPED